MTLASIALQADVRQEQERGEESGEVGHRVWMACAAPVPCWTGAAQA